MDIIKKEEKSTKTVFREPSDRKSDHINLAIHSQTPVNEMDDRFYYEPMISGFPKVDSDPIAFSGKTLKVPIWVSSMTGGYALSGIINRNLARACNEFGMGMGLGSCRRLLEDDTFFNDFNVRPIIGDNQPLFANLGIAQVEELVEKKETDSLRRLIDRLQADGLIVHVNPLQEFFQPEGNIIIYNNIDKPGVIANVTQLLLQYNLNIAYIALSRDEEKKVAMTAIVVDGAVTKELLDGIRNVNGVDIANLVSL